MGDDPPLVGVAVNVTLVPEQIVLLVTSDAMLTLTGRLLFTVIVMALLVAGLPVAQEVRFDVSSTVTISPLFNDDVV